ncbi:MAG: D-amino acid dehydrogenase [Burkholderiales bacterium]|nr:D-amino acid dehydrogenase [Burkholderiales bacterium]
MRVLVLGAGVVGLVSAYFLARDGHRVTVVDRRAGVALEASYANGGQLSYSYVAPLAAPGVATQALRWLLDPGSPLRFHPRLDSHQWRWCLAFLRAANRTRYEASIRELLALGWYSQRLMRELVEREGLEFGLQRNGKIVAYRDPRALAAAARLVCFQRALGAEQRLLDVDELVALEPALADARAALAGAIFTPGEEAGDCHAFCVALQRVLASPALGVEFALGVTIERLHAERGRIAAVATDRGGALAGDAIVVALAGESRALVRPLGVRLPLYPLTGYSLTLPLEAASVAPRISVTDFQNRILYARLAGRLRVAAMVDIGGRGDRIDPQRLATLRAHAQRMFPRAGDFSRTEAWMGQRPATPTGKPIVGATPYRNLYLNVGHGALGFTFATATGKLAADAIAGRASATPAAPFALSPSAA